MDRKEWLKWRHGGIGGSDAPAVMGVSKYMTQLDLYEQKILAEPPEDEGGNFATKRGDRYEPRIRALASMEHGVEYEIALCQSEEQPWRRTSLDGRSPCKTIILEIKVNDRESHALALSGVVPEKHWPQVQHNLDVADASVCWYISYNDPDWDEKNVSLKHMAFVRAVPDKEYLAKLRAEEEKFWFMHVMKKKPPLPSDRDYKTLKAKGLAATVRKYKQLKVKIEELETEFQAVRDHLLDLAKEANHPRCMAGDLKLMQISRIGNVNYNAIPELKGVDLDKYRGKGSVSWTIK